MKKQVELLRSSKRNFLGGRILSILLCLCIVLTLLPTVTIPASAASGTFGAFTVTGDNLSGISYNNSTGQLTIATSSPVTIKNTDPNTATNDHIVVQSGTTANITIENVKIAVYTEYTSAFDMVGATVNLTLVGTNQLSAGPFQAGIRAPSGAKLTITKASTGSLTAKGNGRSGYEGAGIGGGLTSTLYSLGDTGCGDIIIEGGVVNAIGLNRSAGIGGCSSSDSTTLAGGKGGNVTITGGTVVAQGGSWQGAGIGGGGGGTTPGDGGTVVITGGTVNASGYGGGAAIGGAGGAKPGTLKNSSGADLKLYTLTLSGITKATAVTALSLPNKYSYGINGMQTDSSGKLYLYLPANMTGDISATAGGETYNGTIAEGDTTLTPPPYDATVTVNKDETVWPDSTIKITLQSGNDSPIENNSTTAGVSTFKALEKLKSYHILANSLDTGKTVSSSSATATVDYYTLAAASGTHITGAYVNASGTTSHVGLKDSAVAISGGTADTGYEFDKWTVATGGTAPTWEANKSAADSSQTVTIKGAAALTANARLKAPTVTITSDKTPNTAFSSTYTDGETAITLTANADHELGSGVDYTYQWYKDGSILEGKTGKTLPLTKVSDSGSYTCKVKAANKDATPMVSDETASSTAAVTIGRQQVSFKVTNTTHIWDNTKKTISFQPENTTVLQSTDFAAKYYKIDDDTDKVDFTKEIANPRTYGRYVYVIDFAEGQTANQANYAIKDKATNLTGAGADIPTGGNVGVMTLKVQTSPEQADTAVTLSPLTAITYGENCILSATVSQTATDAVSGSVTFMDGDVVIGSAVVKNGTASYTWVRPTGGSHTITAGYSGDLHYKPADTAQSVGLTVSPASQTLSASNVTKTYGESDFQLFASTTGDGKITYKVTAGADVLTVDPATGVVTIKNAGTATVTATAAETPNYLAASTDITVTVNPAKLSVWVTGDKNFDYDGKAHSVTALSSPDAELNISYYKITSDTAYETTSVQSPTQAGRYLYVIAPVSTNYTISRAATVDGNLTAALTASNTGILEIFKPCETTVTVSAPTITYGGNAAITATVSKIDGTGTGGGTISGNVTFSSGSTFLGIGTVQSDGTASVTWQNPNAGAGYTITATYSGDTNYKGSTGDGTLIVNKAQQLVTAASITKTLGDNDFQLSAATRGDGAISYSCTGDVLTITGDMAHIERVGEATVTAKAAATDNYLEGSAEFTVKVNPAGLLLIVSNTTRNTSDTSKGITVQTYPAGVNVSVNYYNITDEGTVGVPVTENGGVPGSDGKYLYVISCNDDNYAIGNAYTYEAGGAIPTASNAGVYTVDTSAQPEFKFAEPVSSKTYEDNDFTITPQGGAVSNTVSYESSDPGIAAVNDATGEVKILKAGTVTITATSTAQGYLPAKASYALVIAKKAVDIRLDKTTVTYNGAVQNIGISDDNDAFEPKFGPGGNITATYVKNSAISVVSARDAGTYLVTARIYDDDPRYTSNSATGYLQIDKAPLAITAKPHTITYGDEPTNAGVIYTELLGTDAGNPQLLSGTLSFTYDYERYEKVGDYVITPSGLSSDNYTITFNPGVLTVEQKAVTLTWQNPGNLVYTASEKTPTVTVGSLVNNDEVGVLVTRNQGFDGKSVGSHSFTAAKLTGDKAANYKLPGDVTHNFAITPATPTITLTNKSAPSTGKPIEIGAAKVMGAGTDGDITASYPDISCIYYTDAACQTQTTDAVGAAQTGGAPSKDGSYYVKATISAKGNYTAANAMATLTIYTLAGGGGGAAPTTPVIAISDVIGGDIKLSPTAPGTGDTVIITVTPHEGYTDGGVTLKDKDGKDVPLVKNSDGTYCFTMPDGSITVTAKFVKASGKSYIDVAEGAYYYNAVLWAVDNSVTSGTSDTTFSPDASCTRAQAVTFLWRAMGSPEPTSKACLFTDVKADAYYYKAVLWAVEKGITVGTGATTFSPDAICSRSQVVTFLWRTSGSPVVDSAMSFTDVDAMAYYAKAVLWAVSEEITSGTGATSFSPGEDCARGQIVTFLYRHYGK